MSSGPRPPPPRHAGPVDRIPPLPPVYDTIKKEQDPGSIQRRDR